MQNPFSFGAIESLHDVRTVNYEPTFFALYDKGGYDYTPTDIEHQHKVGICTAISLIQERQKANGKKYSPEFQYLLQKKFYDGNWDEGSSILSALKVGKKIGFLPANLWTHTTEADRFLPYSQYIAKLKAIPNSEIERLAGKQDSNGDFIGGLCVDKIQGYSHVDVNNPTEIARSISESKAGIICRYVVGMEWYTEPINPLRPPKQVISGHAIIMSKFDFTVAIKEVLANTWGKLWNKLGLADVDWSAYRPTEAWLIVNKTFFLKDLKLGMTDPDVKLLQQFLNTKGFTVALAGDGSIGNETDYFGKLTQKALIKFQIANNIQPSVGYFGIITRTKVNSMV